jgi:outer membrane biosynthesis protein TonB
MNLEELFKQAQDDRIIPVDPGAYTLEIISVKARETDVMPTYRVVSGPFAGKKVMCGVISAKGNAAGFFFAQMKAFGLPDTFLSQPGLTFEKVAQALKGRVIQATLGVRPWNGEDRNEFVRGTIQLVSAPEGSLLPQGVPGSAAAAPQPAAPPVQAQQPAAPPVQVVPEAPPAPPTPEVAPQPVPEMQPAAAAAPAQVAATAAVAVAAPAAPGLIAVPDPSF